MYDGALETGGDGSGILGCGGADTKSLTGYQFFKKRVRDIQTYQLVPRSPVRTTSSRAPWLLFSSSNLFPPLQIKALGIPRILCISHQPLSDDYKLMLTFDWHLSFVRHSSNLTCSHLFHLLNDFLDTLSQSWNQSCNHYQFLPVVHSNRRGV